MSCPLYGLNQIVPEIYADHISNSCRFMLWYLLSQIILFIITSDLVFGKGSLGKGLVLAGRSSMYRNKHLISSFESIVITEILL